MIIGLIGYKGAGKSLAASLLARRGFETYAVADPVRAAAEALNPLVGSDTRLLDVLDIAGGWDNAKRNYPEVRRLLQRLGTEVGRDIIGDDTWVEKMQDRIDNAKSSIVISDLRFDDEVQAVLDAGGIIVSVQRDGYGPSEHRSEQLDMSVAQFVVHNNGSIKDLDDELQLLLKKLEPNNPRGGEFRLVRHEDVSGVSGTGVVAKGFEFDDGTAVLHWETRPTSTSVWNSTDDLLQIHGHDGSTRIEYV